MSPPVVEQRQCWVCLQRRLVCDFGQPSCKKCIKNGVECPGYSEQKPLKWLEPGRVTSKRRKSKRQHIDQMERDGAQNTLQKPRRNIERHLRDMTDKMSDFSKIPEPNRESFMCLGLNDDQVTGGTGKGAEETNEVEELPRRPYGRTRVPLFIITDETVAVVNAVQYYNTQVYPDLARSMQLIKNPYIILFPLHVLPYLPPSIQHTITCYAISHRLHRLQFKEDRNAITGAWDQICKHRGRAIEDIGQCLTKADTRSSPTTITGVLLLLANEIQHPFGGNWRQHAYGLHKMFVMRGGYKKIFEQTPNLRAALVIFMTLQVVANTTSPANDQFSPDSPALLVSHITETYDTIFPHVLCPKSLFLDVITISSIRSQTMLPEFVDDCAVSASRQVLERIESFDPNAWAVERSDENLSSREDWESIGWIYKSAIALYAINSLQSLTVLPKSAKLNASRRFHCETLFKLIRKGMVTASLRKYIFWPAVVSGFEARFLGVDIQDTVLCQLQELSEDLGTATPLHAKAVLRKFWASGKRTWDECFDKPYVMNM